jgi:hypothetical protein
MLKCYNLHVIAIQSKIDIYSKLNRQLICCLGSGQQNRTIVGQSTKYNTAYSISNADCGHEINTVKITKKGK